MFQRRRFATIRCHNNNNNSALLRKQAPGPPRLFPAHVSRSSLARAAAISKPSHGKTTGGSSESEYFIFPPHPEGLGAALGAALDAQLTANPAGMLQAPACQPGEVVEKSKIIFSLPGTAGPWQEAFSSPQFQSSRMAARRAGSPRASSAPGTAGAFQALAAAKQQLLNYGGFFFFFLLFFYLNGSFTIGVKEVINSGCREAGGRLRALPRLSGDRQGEDAAPLSAHAFPAPLAAEPAGGFAS